MIDTYTDGVGMTEGELDHQCIRVRIFRNDYPLFTDTNNLSLLIFLDIGDTSFVLPGDLEKAGWLELLKNRDVQDHLKRVHVFVASHHGRKNGYCPEVFDHCSPSVIVMSDGPIQHKTQQMADTYALHASGVLFTKGYTQENRKVLTTRRDGIIYWEL